MFEATIERLPAPLRSGTAVLVTTYEQWRSHRTLRLGAGLAYYALFAVIPVLSLSVAVAGLVLSNEDVTAYLQTQLDSLLGPEVASAAAEITDQISSSGTIAGLGIIGAVSLVFAASLVVLSLQDALNTIWEMPVRSGLRHSLARRVGAFVVISATGLVLILGFVINSFTAVIDQIVPDVVVVQSLTELVGTAASWALGVGVIVLLFRYLPDVRAPWKSALIGGVLTALFLALGTTLIGIYLRNFGASSVTGAAGAVALVLVWMYYEAQIVLAGAEFTRVLAIGAGTLSAQLAPPKVDTT
jgi:membrane protein